MNPLDNNSVHKFVLQGTLLRGHGEKGPTAAITEELDYVNDLRRISNTTRKLTASNKVHFTVSRSALKKLIVRATPLGEKFEYCLRVDLAAIKREYPLSKFHPFVDLFDRRSTKCNLPDKADGDAAVEAYVEIMNSCINDMREEACSSNFKLELSNRFRATRKNYKGLVKSIDELFDVHGTVLTTRLDLGYAKAYCPPNKRGNHMTYVEAKRHRRALQKFVRKTFGKAFLFFAIRLEYGELKGYHFHALFVFNGNMLQNDEAIAHSIGQYWEQAITLGKGVYYSCNAHKEHYECLGLGKIHHYDMACEVGKPSREGLRQIAVYLTKADYYLKFVDKQQRSFFKGGPVKRKREKRLGRPRKVRVDLGAQDSSVA